MKNKKYAAASLAVIITLTGCAVSGNVADEPTSASPSAESVPETTQVVVADPLERLPVNPFGLDPQALLSYPSNYGINVQLAADKDAVDVSQALRTFLQLKWVENERSPLFTRGKAVIEGSIEDTKHFASPELLELLKDRGPKALDFTAAVEADDDYEATEEIWFPMHFGRIATNNKADSVSHEVSKDWPGVDEDDVAGWVDVDGEEIMVPSMKDAKVELTPRVTDVYDDPEGSTGDVLVRASIEYDLPLVDGRIAEFSIPYTAQMTFHSERWTVTNYWYDVENASKITVQK